MQTHHADSNFTDGQYPNSTVTKYHSLVGLMMYLWTKGVVYTEQAFILYFIYATSRATPDSTFRNKFFSQYWHCSMDF